MPELTKRNRCVSARRRRKLGRKPFMGTGTIIPIEHDDNAAILTYK